MDIKVEKKKQDVIKKSAKLFYYQGYVNTGISEILKECKIPKGSFYYYFKNKEDLLVQVIDYHSDNLIKFFDAVVDDLSSVKLKLFFNKYFNSIIDNDYHGGSLLGNIAIEMSDINEDVRKEVLKNYKKIELRLTLFLEMLKKINSRYEHINSEKVSKILLNQMEGTMLKLKLNKDKSEIDVFFELFDYIMYNEE
ncbi:TetR/AcrR family transcriptional regulator [Oceanivirga salmonicida]|uniref:TetR/AcrR family transcriptional regulator n=1 Tax=Oceanivirga salmonicida TaxID=1769291 RepID=UPI00082B2C48|nr:TetR/AcrR family transcriptional regulator [Oceanivirga salmonicida]